MLTFDETVNFVAAGPLDSVEPVSEVHEVEEGLIPAGLVDLGSLLSSSKIEEWTVVVSHKNCELLYMLKVCENILTPGFIYSLLTIQTKAFLPFISN